MQRQKTLNKHLILHKCATHSHQKISRLEIILIVEVIATLIHNARSNRKVIKDSKDHEVIEEVPHSDLGLQTVYKPPAKPDIEYGARTPIVHL